jgi:putative membrane protein
MASRATWYAILVLAGVSACAREERPSPVPQRVERLPPAPRVATPALSASTYVASAASMDLFVIGSSELALRRSSSQRVHEFARMMIEAHKGMSAQLSLAGRRLNLLPSATLLPEHQAMLDQLQAATDFDGTYRRQQLAVHQKALALHRNYATRGQSPTLKPVAAAAVPMIERHLRLISYL